MTYKTETRHQVDTKAVSSKHDDEVPKRPFPKIKERPSKEKKGETEYKDVFEVAAEFYANRQPVEGFFESICATTQTSISPEVLELIDKFIQMIKHETEKGISITTIDIQILNETQVVFEQRDTAPDSFNIEFRGTEQAIAHIQKNLPFLATALKEHFPEHRFQFRSSLARKKQRKKPVHKLN